MVGAPAAGDRGGAARAGICSPAGQAAGRSHAWPAAGEVKAVERTRAVRATQALSDAVEIQQVSSANFRARWPSWRRRWRRSNYGGDWRAVFADAAR